jgi:ABC-type branched-subunit amino acid transport system substrate-binding protein
VKRVALVAVAALLSACGSTVQVSGTAAVGAEGTNQLGQPVAGAALPTTPGSATSANGGSTQLPSGQGMQPGTVAPTVGSVAIPSPGQSQGPSARITAPLELGFIATSVGNAAALGLNAGQTYTDKAAYEALVKEYNARGGLAGRKIVPVYGETDTASNDWSTQFQAACQHLTQDHHVKAVVGYIFVFLDSFEQCLAKAGVSHLYGGYQPGDIQAQKDFPTIVSVAHPTVEVANETVLAGAIASGRLTKKNRLGVLYDGCAHGERAFKTSTEPYLKRNGITYETFYGDCSAGAGDAGAAAAAVKSAQLQFSARGVDVVFASNAIALLLFMENAESQGYRPSYINSGFGAAFEAQGGAVPQPQLRNLHGYGWMPGIDVGQAHQPYAATAEQRACLGKLKNQGLVPQQYNDFMFAFVTCDSLDLYDRALRLTGGRTEAAVLQGALLKVMPSFTGSATYGGAYGVGPRQRGGPGQYREIGYVDACSCFQYRGPVRRVPTA